ncbi:hypothetical protein [Desulfonema limicola]|uniref:hypothetical protein n=1 Tax=Desulfonema limicola TaxID=45656 RepID=UPI001A9BE32A|nr:hypothetical protein [Desulfonema limicola]
MAYTPELSGRESAMLRRIAWYVGRPMTKTLSAILKENSEKYKCGEVCKKCKDKSKCGECVFNSKQSTKERSL